MQPTSFNPKIGVPLYNNISIALKFDKTLLCNAFDSIFREGT